MSRQPTPTRQTANRRAISEIPYSIAINQYGSTGQNCALSALDSFVTGLAGAASFGFWVKGSDLATVPAYIFGANPAAGGTYCFVGVNRTSGTLGKINLQLRDNGGDSLGVQCDKPILDGKWHHVVITKDATNTAAGIKFYVDGVLRDKTTIVASGTFNDPVAIGRAAMLGSASSGSGLFSGLLAQFGLWQRELTSAEVVSWHKDNIIPTSAHRYFACDTNAMTTTLVESVAADNGTLDSVNMWSDQSPRGGRKSVNLFN